MWIMKIGFWKADHVTSSRLRRTGDPPSSLPFLWPHPAFCGFHLARDRQVGAELYVRLSMFVARYRWGQMHVTSRLRQDPIVRTAFPILFQFSPQIWFS